jgi:hypothetical protein
MTKDDKPGCGPREPAELWQDLVDLFAESAAEAGAPTDDDLTWSAALDADVKSRLAEMRRRLTPGHVPIRRGVDIPSEIEAMDRAALVKQLEMLRQGGQIRYAQRELTGLTDHDLRNMLAVYLQTSGR